MEYIPLVVNVALSLSFLQMTPLIMSSWRGHSQVVELLLSQREVHINARTIVSSPLNHNSWSSLVVRPVGQHFITVQEMVTQL